MCKYGGGIGGGPRKGDLFHDGGTEAIKFLLRPRWLFG